MRRASQILVGAMLLSALVGAQGTKRARKHRELLTREGTAGPGYVQGRFLTHLEEALTGEINERRSTAMLASLRRARPKAREVIGLMNGNATKSKLQRMFGAKRRELTKTRRAVNDAVERKNRRVFFGVMAFVMIGEFDIEASSPFLRQILAARDELKDDEFRTLRIGSHRTKKRMREYFDLRSEEDQQLMLKILDRTRASFYMNHPLCESLGIGRARDYDPDEFPKLTDGMPGSEKDYADGEVSGLAFDRELPPLPFMGARVDKLLDLKKQQ